MYRYAPIQRILHWLIALLVIGNLIGGQVIESFGDADVDPAFRDMVYMLHKSFGVTILALMLARLAARLLLGKPAYRMQLARWRRIASEATHGGLYVLLLLMPVLGWLATATGGFPVEFFGSTLPPIVRVDKELSPILFAAHGVVGKAIIALAALHILAALEHALRRDGLLSRML